ncbi:MAG: heme biosynthesis HemY N-terminal domain-containing protein [Paracoccaceae bacterium]
MIWSLFKILLFVMVIIAATFGAGLMMDTGGVVRVAFSGWEFSLGPLQSVIAILLLVSAVWLALKAIGLLIAILRFLNGDETAVSRYFDRNRERRGYQSLADGMLALAGGEGRLALIKAQRAAGYLDRPELTNLLIAQAAETAGDTKRAGEAYKSLLADPRTRFVAIRGLLKQKLAEGDTETALKLAEKAFEMKPRHADSQDILLKLQSESADWKGARSTLGAQLKSGALPREVYRRRDAVLALQEASVVVDENATIDAREAAIAANKLSPDLIPAASMAARFYIQKGDKKNATRVLKKAWEARPHPDLAAAFAEIEPEETPAQRVKRFKTLTAIHPENSETMMLQAELNIAAEDFPAARRALGDLPTSHPTQRSLAIMAAVERGEGSDDATVRAWLSKALTASRGPQWCCDKCQAIHADWHPICENCGGFDTLSWREPVETSGKSATGAELLPLLVAAPNRPAPPPEPDEPIDLEAVVRGAN